MTISTLSAFQRLVLVIRFAVRLVTVRHFLYPTPEIRIGIFSRILPEFSPLPCAGILKTRFHHQPSVPEFSPEFSKDHHAAVTKNFEKLRRKINLPVDKSVALIYNEENQTSGLDRVSR